MLSMYTKLSHLVLIVLFLSKVEKFEMKSVHFQSKPLNWIPRNPNTTDLYSESVMECILLCVLNDLCLTASYSVKTYTCRIDLSGKHFFLIEPMDGWTVVKRTGQPTMSVTGCINHGLSMYIIVDEATNWTTAKKNCYKLGGKLAELETTEENDFMKNTLTVRNAGDLYFLGGYKFGDGMRWISTPSQSWTFTDMGLGEPSHTNEMCLGSFAPIGFQWGDVPCDWLKSYICEFSD